MKKRLFVPVLFFMPFLSANAQSINAVLSENDYLNRETSQALTIKMPAEEAIPDYIISGKTAYYLTKEEKPLDRSSQDIFAENFDNIYPGAIVFVNEDLANGDPTLVNLGYGTVTVRVDFNSGGSSSRQNVKNSPDEIQNAIHSMLNEKTNFQPQVKLSNETRFYSSKSQMAADLNVSLSFLKAKASVNTSLSNSSSTITEVENLTQEFYTVLVTPESDNSKYFGPNVTGSDLKKKIQQFKAPVGIIISVSYGRRAYRFKDYSSSDFKFKGSESASGWGQSVSSNQDIANSTMSKKEWMYISGGDANSASQILNGSSIASAISQNLKYNATSNQGTPLYYKVRFLGSGRTATIKRTGKYTEVKYDPMFSNVSCTFRNNATHVAGAELKMRIDYNVVKIVNGQKVPVAKEKEAFSGYTTKNERNMSFGDKTTFKLDIGPGEFLDGLIRFQCRCKKGSGKDWDNDTVGDVYPDENGVLDIDVHGAIRPGGTKAYIHSSSKTKYVQKQN